MAKITDLTINSRTALQIEQLALHLDATPSEVVEMGVSALYRGTFGNVDPKRRYRADKSQEPPA